MKTKIYILFISLFINVMVSAFANDIEGGSQILKLVDGDHYLGDTKAKVTIIEYSSLSCPGCSSFHESIFSKIKENTLVLVMKFATAEQQNEQNNSKAS